jgi:hypothetical protein
MKVLIVPHQSVHPHVISTIPLFSVFKFILTAHYPLRRLFLPSLDSPINSRIISVVHSSNRLSKPRAPVTLCSYPQCQKELHTLLEMMCAEMTSVMTASHMLLHQAGMRRPALVTSTQALSKNGNAF